MELIDVLVERYQAASKNIAEDANRIMLTFPIHLVLESIRSLREKRDAAAVDLADAIVERMANGDCFSTNKPE